MQKSIVEYKKLITNKIKQARFEEALQILEDCIEQIGDKTLQIKLLSLHARFSTEFNRYLSGESINLEEQNKIIYALTHLLHETEDIAKEKGFDNPIVEERENLEILDRYAGVYENYYLNDVGNQNFLSRNIYKFYNDGTVKLKNYKNIIFNGRISTKLEGRFFVLSDFKDKDGNEYDFMSILRLPWVADKETELLGVYAGISHSSVIPKVGRDYFRRITGTFDSLLTKKIYLQEENEVKRILVEIPHLIDFFLGKYEQRDTHKFIDIIR